MNPPLLLKKFDATVGIVALLAFFLLLAEQAPVTEPFLPVFRKINFGVLLFFTADVLLRFFSAPGKISHLKTHFFDLIVFIPYVQFVEGIENYSFFTIVRQAVIVVMLIGRTKRTHRFVASLGLKPAQLMITSFFFTICVGALLLSLPISTIAPGRTSLLDAFFTSTSATCVTGLVVHDTGSHFTLFGQLVILVLIQLGGLGIMTFSVFLAVLGGKRMALRQRIVMHDVLDRDSLTGATRLILFIVKMTVIIEICGAVALLCSWNSRFPPIAGAYHALFHSISAFCNAGFSTFSNSLMDFSGDVAVNAVIAVLIILGGLGFVAVRDLYLKAFPSETGSARRRRRLRIQTRIVLTVTVMLVAVGALAFAALENSLTAPEYSIREMILIPLFQSISTRTAGFNSCDLGTLSHATLFAMAVLMFIGASPGSTAGGLKTTTFAVLWANMWNGFSPNENVEIYKRTIPAETTRKAVTVLLFYMALLVPAIIILSAVEKLQLMHVLFESVSAVATVGLSTGITSGLSAAGKAVVILLMFVGRLGPLTIGYAFMLSPRRSGYTYAEERVTIG